LDVAGGFKVYWAVPATSLLRGPDTLVDRAAAVIVPHAVAALDVRRAGVKAGDTVLVFGGGPIGTLIAMVCRERGARVAVAEVNRFRIEMLQNLGLPTVGPDADVVKFANDWTGGIGVDIAFEVTGHPAAVRAVTAGAR